MTSHLAISPWLHGDPLSLGPEVHSAEQILAALRASGARPPGEVLCEPLAPDGCLLHGPGAPATPLSLMP